jgi:hypothetical protein
LETTTTQTRKGRPALDHEITRDLFRAAIARKVSSQTSEFEERPLVLNLEASRAES